MIRALLAALVLALVPAPAHGATVRQSTLHQVNAVRWPDVRQSACAARYAARWAAHLARSGRFYHRDMSRLLRACHARRAGEIMALHVRSPRQAVRLWLHSPSHRRVMLRHSYTHAGTGAVRLSDGTYLLVVDFLEYR